MSQAFTPALQLSSKTIVRKVRELPVPGEIMVKMGESVSAGDIVAKADLPGELHILRIPERMGIEPFEAVKGLRVKEGDRVAANGLVCEHYGLFGLFKTRFLSPLDGLVEMISQQTGHVGIRAAARPIELQAYISGRVVNIEPAKSVVIEAQAALVQGIFGVGGERNGILELLDLEPDKRIGEQDIPADAEGKILAGGTSPSLEALRCAAERGAAGMVIGAIDDAALKGYLGYDLGIALTGDEDIPMTLIATEGFGEIPMARRIVDLFECFKGKAASMNGATQVRAGAVRPEVIICHSGGDETAQVARTNEQRGLQVGSRIRIVRVPYFGALAEVVSLPAEPRRLETGAFARVLEARLTGGGIVVVPRANVELAEF